MKGDIACCSLWPYDLRNRPVILKLGDAVRKTTFEETAQ
jgi:hypothetical protein